MKFLNFLSLANTFLHGDSFRYRWSFRSLALFPSSAIMKQLSFAFSSEFKFWPSELKYWTPRFGFRAISRLCINYVIKILLSIVQKSALNKHINNDRIDNKNTNLALKMKSVGDEDPFVPYPKTDPNEGKLMLHKPYRMPFKYRQSLTFDLYINSKSKKIF